MGIGHKTKKNYRYQTYDAGEVDYVYGPLMTFKDILYTLTGDEDKRISYLKIDIEGSEVKAMKVQ